MAAKKELIVVPKGPRQFVLQFAGGGQLPKELKGVYTKPHLAERAAKFYLNHVQRPKPVEEVQKDAPERSSES